MFQYFSLFSAGNDSLEDAVKKDGGLFTANRFYSVHVHVSGMLSCLISRSSQ